MVRNSLLLSFAVLIDLLQACISAGLFVIGLFPGTTAGGTAGAAVGSSVAGGTGAAVGGFLGGLAGSLGNVAAAYTLPFAIGLGFAVNFCLDVTLGTVLVLWLISQGMYYPGYTIAGFIFKLIPGAGTLPGWTGMTWFSIKRKNAEIGQKSGTFSNLVSLGNFASAGASLATGIQQGAIRMAGIRDTTPPQAQNQEQGERQSHGVNSELKNIDGITAPRIQPANDNTPSESLRYAA